MNVSKLLLFFSLTLLSALCTAKEPVNLEVTKQALVHYHDSGQYENDINVVIDDAIRYLKIRIADTSSSNNKKPAIILDIDETALSNYSDILKLHFGGTLSDIQKAADKGVDPVIAPTLKLYQFAKSHQIAIFFLTGRSENERALTVKNLQQAGYANWNGLILRSKGQEHIPAAIYKTAIRKELSTKGYDIVLSMGDQQSDLVGGYADKTFKLPNPYYFIP